MEHKTKFELDANPYGYGAKKIDAPSGTRHLIGIAGNDSGDFEPGREYGEYDLNFNPSVNVQFKNKGVSVIVFHEGLSKSVELSELEHVENKWFFQKTPAPHCLGFILQVGKFDEHEFGAVFDSNFLLTIKVDNVERYMMIRVLSSNGESVPDDIFNAVGKWIGSVANMTIDDSIDKDMALKKVSESITFNFSNPDKKVLRQQHQFFAEARWGSLKKFQSHKLDPLTTKDPLGNTVAHLAVHNPHLEVFPHIATKYPTLLTTQNVFGNTPLHNLALLRSRQLNAEYFEWKYIWSLPWNFSLKNKKGQTAVEKLCEIGGKDLMQAFQALFDNKEAWQSVKKCHEVSKLLSVVLTKYFADGATNSPEEDVLRTAKLFVEQGVEVKGAVFDTALRYSLGALALHLLSIGAEVTYNSVVAAFSTKRRAIADIVLQRFDLRTLSQQQLSLLCDNAVDAGWVDVINLLASKGCVIPLVVNNREKTSLPVANLVARMNSHVVLPLKYLGVDAINESVEEEKREKLLQTLPEELRDIFHEKELWRWTLFLEDEEKRNRYLQLYGAIARAQRTTEFENIKELLLSIGDVEFSVKSIWRQEWPELKNVGLGIWSGSEEPDDVKLIYEISSYNDGNPKKSRKPRTVKAEKNPEVLKNLLASLGWPNEDAYIFLLICYYAFPYKHTDRNAPATKILPGEIQVNNYFFQHIIFKQVDAPKWYRNFIRKVYGVVPKITKLKMTDSNSVSDESASSSE